MKLMLRAAVAGLALVATACVADDVESSDGGSNEPPVSRPTTSVVRTIPEEAPTTTGAVRPETTEDLGAPPERRWLDEQFELLPVAELESPTALTARSGGDDLWVTERPGRVRQIQRRLSVDEKEESLQLLNTVVLDITDRVAVDSERGLLGLAFSTDGRFLYVSYNNSDGDTVIAEYEMDVITAIPATERILLQVPQPYANHNGGQITVGPDGFLYVALGDGGSGGDPEQHGQNTETLLGSILRIDPLGDAGDEPYAIPADNPFSETESRPEIWTYGVRNPWRFSFDRETGDLWVADVGQDELEEITVLPDGDARAGRGANLGWRTLEGDRFFDGDELPDDYAGPTFVYDHSNGRCSITGGYVYRGSVIQALDGIYIFADFCSNEIFGLEALGDGRIVVSNLKIDRTPDGVISFGEGSGGEVYVLEIGGQISRLHRPGTGPETTIFEPGDDVPGGAIDDGVQPGGTLAEDLEPDDG